MKIVIHQGVEINKGLQTENQSLKKENESLKKQIILIVLRS